MVWDRADPFEIKGEIDLFEMILKTWQFNFTDKSWPIKL